MGDQLVGSVKAATAGVLVGCAIAVTFVSIVLVSRPFRQETGQVSVQMPKLQAIVDAKDIRHDGEVILFTNDCTLALAAGNPCVEGAWCVPASAAVVAPRGTFSAKEAKPVAVKEAAPPQPVTP